MPEPWPRPLNPRHYFKGHWFSELQPLPLSQAHRAGPHSTPALRLVTPKTSLFWWRSRNFPRLFSTVDAHAAFLRVPRAWGITPLKLKDYSSQKNQLSVCSSLRKTRNGKTIVVMRLKQCVRKSDKWTLYMKKVNAKLGCRSLKTFRFGTKAIAKMTTSLSTREKMDTSFSLHAWLHVCLHEKKKTCYKRP